MRPSTRFVLPIAVVALACTAIIWPRWLEPRLVDPCARADILSVTALIPGSLPEGEMKDRLTDEIVQWSSGRIPDELLPEDPLLFRIVRNFNVLKGAEHPLLLMPNRVEAETQRVDWIDAPGGPLPVHVVRTVGHNSFELVTYFYVYGNEPVSFPLLPQIRGALRELRHGRLPLTVVLAGGRATADTVQHREELALRWLTSAWQHYRVMCIEPGRATSRESRGVGAPP